MLEVSGSKVDRTNLKTVEELQKTLPWVEKYRPNTLEELCSQENVVGTIQKFISERKLSHLLFYGPPGTGKTSTILALAKLMYGPRFRSMILELNASDDRGIDVVREKIKAFASTRIIFSSGFKLIILDEADAMTNAAQSALRRVIEKYTKNVRFCLICNYISKIIPAIQSRCASFRFQPLLMSSIEKRLEHVVQSEKITLTDDGRKALLRLSKGDMRKVLNILQAASVAHDVVDEKCLYECTGQPMPQEISNVITWMLNDPLNVAFKNIIELKVTKSLSTADLLTEVHLYSSRIAFPPSIRIFLLDNLSIIERRVASGTSDDIQLSAMIAVFVKAREAIAALTE